jgi:regulator of sigma E protease
MSWFLAFAGFAALIILHEFGHFIAAKATGMRVERFFLFFPPKLVSVKRGETEYGIGAIPLGGFVKITGMNPDELREPEADSGAAIGHPELTATEAADAANPAQALMDRIEGPSEPMTPEIRRRAYYNQPVWKRIVVIGAGPAMNLLIAFVILFVLAFGVQRATALAVSAIEDDSPAAAKLQEGDRLISVDGVRPTDGGDSPSADQLGNRAEALANQVDTHRCPGQQTDGCRAATPAHIVVERDGHRVAFDAYPVYDADVERHRLGFRFEGAGLVAEDPSPPEAARLALDQMWQVTSGTVSVFARIFESEQRKQLSGVVGSYEVTRQAIEFDARAALTLLAVISLSLAIINLFPFLPLDGGHIFWSLVEKVRGRPVPFATMERAGAIGFMLILFIAFIGLSNDIGRLTGEGFNVR